MFFLNISVDKSLETSLTPPCLRQQQHAARLEPGSGTQGLGRQLVRTCARTAGGVGDGSGRIFFAFSGTVFGILVILVIRFLFS